jgi:predicted AAA+ superfamily ATPase
MGMHSHLYYWRDYSDREIDWVIDHQGEWIPIEVKWGDVIKPNYLRHLEYFITKNPAKVKRGYIIFTGLRPQKLTDQITALPFHDFLSVIFAS